MPSHRQRVRLALKVPSSEIEEFCKANTAPHALDLSYAVRRTNELSPELQDAIWALLETNMRALASASSMGWNHDEKYEETFHRFSRFVLVFQGPEPLPAKLVAFTLFRFDTDFDDNVVYCYEVQVNSATRNQGLGRVLMSLLEHIGSKWEMDKVMLTVLKANERAIRFYRSVGYDVDETSPDPEDEADYEIMSKHLEIAG